MSIFAQTLVRFFMLEKELAKDASSKAITTEMNSGKEQRRRLVDFAFAWLPKMLMKNWLFLLSKNEFRKCV